MRFPLRYVRANVLFGAGGERVALYRLGMVSYPFLGVGEKWALARRLERFARVVGGDFSLWRVNRAYPASGYPRQVAALLDERHGDPDGWRSFLDGHRERLQTLGSHVPEVYLAVSLKAPAVGPGESLLRAVDRARRRVEGLARVGPAAPVSHSELVGLAQAEQRVFERLRGVLSARRASTREIGWLLRRAALRGVCEPAEDRHFAPDALIVRSDDGESVYEPLSHDLWRCVNAAITERTRTLVIDAEEGSSHQALLAIGSLAEAPVFPGPSAELLFGPLEALAFPIDAVLHARWVGNHQALAQVRKRIADVEHAFREQLEGSAYGPGLLASEDRVLAREYEAILQAAGHPPMLYASIGLAVGAPDETELERRVDALRESYGDISLHRPAGLQSHLFAEHLPRADGSVIADYVQQLTVEQFGALVAVATREVGSLDGVYIGFTPTGVPRPVRYDPTAPSRESRPSTVLLAGSLGSGKTVAAQLIAYVAARRGSLIVDFDPKPDHGLQRAPGLAGVQVIELSGDPSQRGRLDPLAVGSDDFREELACSYFLELLRDPPPAWENAIGRAVRDVIRSGQKCSLAVIEALKRQDTDAGRDAGEALEVLSDFGLARLAFGDQTTDAAPVLAAVTTIRTPGLLLPDPHASRETYTRSERVSVATLTLLAAYSLRLLASDRSHHKLLLFDEVSFLAASAQGRAVLERLIRMGRAFNATLLFATQLVHDLGELARLIGTFLIFGQDSDQEARDALILIGLDPEDRGLVAMLREFREGRCLMRDLHGRIGDVQIDLVFDDLLRALSTSPPEHRKTA